MNNRVQMTTDYTITLGNWLCSSHPLRLVRLHDHTLVQNIAIHLFGVVHWQMYDRVDGISTWIWTASNLYDAVQILEACFIIWTNVQNISPFIQSQVSTQIMWHKCLYAGESSTNKMAATSQLVVTKYGDYMKFPALIQDYMKDTRVFTT